MKTTIRLFCKLCHPDDTDYVEIEVEHDDAITRVDAAIVEDIPCGHYDQSSLTDDEEALLDAVREKLEEDGELPAAARLRLAGESDTRFGVQLAQSVNALFNPFKAA